MLLFLRWPRTAIWIVHRKRRQCQCFPGWLSSTRLIMIRPFWGWPMIIYSLPPISQRLGLFSIWWIKVCQEAIFDHDSWTWSRAPGIRMFYNEREDDEQFWLWSPSYERRRFTNAAWVHDRPWRVPSHWKIISDFYWCGYAIDMKDLSVSADYTRYHGLGKTSFWLLKISNWTFLDLSNTLTVSRGHKPGERFVSKMLL